MASVAPIRKAPVGRALNFKGAFDTGKNARGMEWEEALTLFLRSRRLGTCGAYRQVRERTIKEYKWDLGKFFDYMKTKKKFTHYNQMQRRDVLDFVDWLNKKEWAQASKNKYLKSLKAFFNWVKKEPDCVENKMMDFVVDIPKIPKNPPRLYVPAPDVMYQFLKSFDQKVRWGLRDYVVLSLMLDCGARIGEICFLKESHIKFDAAMILIPQEGKTGERLVPVDRETTIPALKRWIRERERFAKCDYLFLNKFGGQCKPHTFDQSFKYQRRRTELGLSEHGNLCPHSVRHFFCTYYLVNGGSLHNLQRITGHKTLETLMIYVHLANQINSVAEEHSRVSPLKNLQAKSNPQKKKRKMF
jgi:integrase/recombinase XerD